MLSRCNAVLLLIEEWLVDYVARLTGVIIFGPAARFAEPRVFPKEAVVHGLLHFHPFPRGGGIVALRVEVTLIGL